jgi:hypothetical protein
MRARTVTVVATAIAVLAVAGSAAVRSGAASGPAYAKLCKTITGPQWTLPGVAARSGRRYEIGALDFSCASATRYVRKFYVRRSAGLQTRLSGGPAGYVCRSTAPKARKVYQGACKKRRGRSILSAFAWAPKR